jgi:hypothetical protein
MEDNSKQSNNQLDKGGEFQDLINKDVYFMSFSLPGTLSQTATNFGYIFTPSLAMEILCVLEKHTAASGAATTLDLVIVKNGSAIGTGVSVLKTPFALNSAANTTVAKYGVNLSSVNRTANPLDSFALVNSASNATLQGVSITIVYAPANRGGYRKGI